MLSEEKVVNHYFCYAIASLRYRTISSDSPLAVSRISSEADIQSVIRQRTVMRGR